MFEAEIDCNIPGALWCGELYVLEQDVVFPDLLRIDRFCTSKSKKMFRFDVYPGSDFPTVDLELTYKFNHNCSADGETYCVKPKWSKKVNGRVGQSVGFDIDARPHGKPSRCKPPFYF
ncbi:Transthyretin-like family protein [Caenorhabditis elegans]|uniref:Transthyretin-like family protein n=1 Tax=Caenorhabditis elegans TaxID=6239 RepID=Q20094_CAEEL|nr:Transthyretin-like family protein [Caenorhabditis elegans]CCD69524.1 Transthyretin-like family protein [Caenorhabditis elegans]|eukprot:NP_500527.1 Uncharacterized protein CELE_F36A4.3 [Caenorhabditis elegans]